MAAIRFSEEQREAMQAKLRDYLEQELDLEIGSFEAEFLLDFIGKEIGAYYYNQGLHDAHTAMAAKLDELAEVIYEIEQPV